MTAACTRIAVIGGGFTGTVFAVHLLRRLRSPVAIDILEPRGALGRGIAYGTPRPEHRANVPSQKMWVFHEDRWHFTEWLHRTGRFHGDSDALSFDGDHYSQRRDFGDYMAQLLADARANAHDRVAVTHHHGRALDIRLCPNGGFGVRRTDGAELSVDRVVIAASHGAPAFTWPMVGTPRTEGCLVTDPWAEDALAEASSVRDVLILGTGLTMADVLVSLRQKGHNGRVRAISRRGLLPRRQGEFDESFDWLDGEPVPQTAGAFLRLLRRRVAELDAAGRSWHPAIDSLRRSLPTIWAQIPVSERSRIVRRLRVYWDVHRYRLAPQVAATLDDALRIGQLEVSAGRIHRIEATAGGFDVIWQARGQAHASREAFDAIINCTGPDADVGRSSNALFRNLLAYGLVRPDPLRLGLDVDAESRALDGEGRPVPGLYVTGPLTRGRFGEVMGVPDASKHARWVADRIATEIAK